MCVLNEIVLGERSRIAELGAGVSTLVIARLLEQRGTGKLVSLEHDPDWARVVGSWLEAEGLTPYGTLAETKLADHPLSWDRAPWYESVDELPERIDLLLVDGPPGYGEGMSHSRYPALPALADRLTTEAIVILDDADRRPEREIAERWRSDLPDWEIGIDTRAGIAIARRKAG